MENRNNFLRWSGSLLTTPFDNVAQPVSVAMITNAPYIDISVLAGATSTFGIDPSSVTIASYSPNDQRPPVWNAATQKLRVFRPDSMPSSSHSTIRYYFKDWQGNPSNTAIVDVDLTLLGLDWRVLSTSAYCLTNSFNVKTGEKGYRTLELYYTATNAAYVPATTKPNAIGDPDYVAPVTDIITCPLPSTAPLTIANNTPAGTPGVTLVSFTWKKAPNPDIVNVVNLIAGQQTTINFPTGIYDELQIVHAPTGGSINAAGFESRYYPGNSNPIITALTDINSPTIILNPVHAQPGSTIALYP